MSTALDKHFINQLEAAMKLAKDVKAASQYGDLSDMNSDPRTMQAIAANRAAVIRASGPNSPYSKQVYEIVNGVDQDALQAVKIGGVTEALRNDLQAGFMQSYEEVIHGELFGDFLEMAEHLMDSGYKDAAAVVAGSALEAHLRQLCNKNSLSVDVVSAAGTKPKKADQMNAELANAGAYSKLDQKSVTSWLDLRNKAAHGKYAEYTKDQVALVVAGVRGFITRNPA
jgi:hypothetical protein